MENLVEKVSSKVELPLKILRFFLSSWSWCLWSVLGIISLLRTVLGTFRLTIRTGGRVLPNLHSVIRLSLDNGLGFEDHLTTTPAPPHPRTPTPPPPPSPSVPSFPSPSQIRILILSDIYRTQWHKRNDTGTLVNVYVIFEVGLQSWFSDLFLPWSLHFVFFPEWLKPSPSSNYGRSFVWFRLTVVVVLGPFVLSHCLLFLVAPLVWLTLAHFGRS